jgi:hypothetical protein
MNDTIHDICDAAIDKAFDSGILATKNEPHDLVGDIKFEAHRHLDILSAPLAPASDARELARKITAYIEGEGYDDVPSADIYEPWLVEQLFTHDAALLASRQGEAPMISDYTQGYEDCFARKPNREVPGSQHPSETAPEGAKHCNGCTHRDDPDADGSYCSMCNNHSLWTGPEGGQKIIGQNGLSIRVVSAHLPTAPEGGEDVTNAWVRDDALGYSRDGLAFASSRGFEAPEMAYYEAAVYYDGFKSGLLARAPHPEASGEAEELRQRIAATADWCRHNLGHWHDEKVNRAYVHCAEMLDALLTRQPKETGEG